MVLVISKKTYFYCGFYMFNPILYLETKNRSNISTLLRIAPLKMKAFQNLAFDLHI